MKKKILVLFMMLFTLFLSSCDSACSIETTDADGNVVTMDVTKTEDKEEVAKVISALSNVEVEEDETYTSTRATISSSMDFKGKNTYAGNSFGYSAKVSLESNEEAQMHAGVDFSLKYALTSNEETLKNTISLEGDIYSDLENLYIKGTAKHNNGTLELKNKASITEIISGLEGMLGNVDTMLPSVDTDMTLPDLSTNEDILNFIEEYGITISSTTGSTITFKMNVAAKDLDETIESDAKLVIYVTLDIKKMLPVGFKIDASAMLDELKKEQQDIASIKFTFEVKLEYGTFEIETLSDSSKHIRNLICLLFLLGYLN